MRELLLECAVDHFGRFGFEGAATRAIAADCGTAMSSITYHFGGKEGLYLAVADHIAAQISQSNAANIEAARAAPVHTPHDAVELLVILLDTLAAMMLSEQSARWARFITREQHEPTEAFGRIYAQAMQPMIEIFSHLIAQARPDLGDREQQATSFFLLGEAMALRNARALLGQMLENRELDADAELLMRQRLGAHARAILSATPETDR